MRYVVEKGSIAIDGASLTVNSLDHAGFSVVLIPHSQGILHLSERAPGAHVNLESDIIGKYVERLLSFDQGDRGAHTASPSTQGHGSSLDLSTLAKAGFLR